MTRPPLSGDRALAAAAASVALAVVAAAAVLVGARGADPPPPPARFTIGADFDPRSYLFGDLVDARVDLEFDRRAVDAETVRLWTRFAPYTVVAQQLTRRSVGNTVSLRYRFALRCLAIRCTPRGGPVTVQLTPGRVEYRLRSGERRTLVAPWPDSYVHTRLLGTPLQAGDPRIRPAWRLPTVPPAVSYRARPALVAGVLYGAAALLAVAAAVLLAPQARRIAAALWRREDSLAGLPPLERALALLERALVSGADAEQRKALDRLARELRSRGDDDLARAARRLAWSSGTPAEEARALTGAVARTLASRA